ncbi:MAG: hypothetical protein LBR57_00120 [Alistipes sp.]|jgi:hypothetical protein|nr:hypothetical protein [Alistipes sp.]
MKKTAISTCACALAAALTTLTISLTGCSGNDAASPMSNPSSRGGSMARFAIAGDWLYTVNDSDLSIVSVKNPQKPVCSDEIYLGWGIETIFPMDNMLFIGSQTGMHIYDISNPEFPKWKSTTTHFKSCDPVVAYENLAFVTLNSSAGTWCGTRGDVLQVYDITDLESPVRLSETGLSSPRGLAVDGAEKLVFVCDGGSGIKAIDVTDPKHPEPMFSSINTENVTRIDAYDCLVWPDEKRLLVVGSDGLYQLRYDRENKQFTLISKFDLRKE